jgi:hypothetical protein
MTPVSRVAVAALFIGTALGRGVHQPSGLDATRVLVSRREVRVLFPAETTHRWGWPSRNASELNASYGWTVLVEGIDGPRLLTLSALQTDERARAFASLEELVAASRAALCLPGMMRRCSDAGVRARVEGKSVVLALGDSSTIDQLFGARPSTVEVYRGRPGASDQPGKPRVEYIDPQISELDSAQRADVARRRRQYQASVNSIKRWIGGGAEFGVSAILVETGDSTIISVDELHCSYDACGGFSVGVPDSSWTLDDTTIAVIRRPGPKSIDGMLVYSSEGPFLHGRRRGTTMLRVHDIHTPSDTMPSRDPVPSNLQRELRVLPTLARVQIVPRPDTVRAGESVDFRVRVVARSGEDVADLPVEWRIRKKGYSEIGVQGSPRSIRFDSTGTATIVARVGRRADSLTVIVSPPRRH